MGSRGGLVLLGLLFILAVLCHVGYSLECYSCINPIGECKTAINCTHNENACLFVKAVPTKTYYQCWMYDQCTFETIAKHLGEKKLEYKCCQKNLCNKSGGTSVSGKTAPLVLLLLVAIWHICL
ncbi:CD59 glycoprotein [Hippopotamus amphibius kiboko]|uniref:CD59 glycoprotein n=1 Tax=Hippopotamus amphibius kiboko TaxID=575201 RepID=UPI002596AE04|nr:CD59 glycoprotein [Hippopotamus amphibius kiboko]XP_057605575.1 CD59 glycoprotein [Hippopotamus amphibius kiboko]